ncbi:MAG TPA: response regulator, partial [Nitrospirota bacterium]|nr:response regulator [Nitrospirota bacterium]
MKRIIIVDDEELMRYSLTAAFRNETTEVVALGDGKTALQALNLFPVDLCFLDVNLPDMNGLDIMQRLRKYSPKTRIIIMTGSEITDAMLKSIRDNAHALVAKPFELSPLKKFVGRILEANAPLSSEESSALKDSTPSLRWIADDFRKGERRPLLRRITCCPATTESASSANMITADVVDISETGVCILTEQSL